MEFDKISEENQFLSAAPNFNPREGQKFVDEQDLDLEWNTSESESQVDEDESEREYSLEVDDEDWEIAEKDFTKQYNRMKQQLAVQSGSNIASTMEVSNSKRPRTVAPMPAVNKSSHSKADLVKLSHQQQLEALSKYSSKIANIHSPYMLRVGVNPKGASQTANLKDKSDRATNEQVLDPRTRLILFKMIGRGLVSEVNGCVSTGKEANVYHALSQSLDLPLRSPHIALKIYKTSVLIFKDRDRYVTGEYRFRRGYSKRNPRKMVRLWAEKEMRNLKRLNAAGIPCPEPFEVRENVLVMSFLGDQWGWASPRLKDASVPQDAFPKLYVSLLITVRKMFHECKLVHADLSEYNILYHENRLYIIDVSQSVEHDHPNAFDFLRSDLKNIEEFFERKGVVVIGLRRSFEFVTKIEEEFDADGSGVLEKWMIDPEPEMTKDHGEITVSEVLDDDAVFLQAYIPRTLNEVYDPERDIDLLKSGKNGKLIYEDTIGIVDGSSNFNTKEVNIEDESTSGSDLVSGCISDSEEENAEFTPKIPRGHRHEDRNAKKERKKAVKEEAKERRKNKMPKAEKKKRIKASRGG